MRGLFGTLIGYMMLTCGGAAVFAQSATIPFKQLEHDARLSAGLGVAASESLMTGTSASSSASGLVGAASYEQPVYKRERVFDSKFFLVNGLHMGLAALDIGLTQHCIATHRCREGNPLMPSSAVGQAAVNSAFVGYSFFISYRMKKHESKAWWIAPIVGTGAHTVGAVSGFMNR